jgi:adenosylcobinamide-GDP ribazoletransferase
VTEEEPPRSPFWFPREIRAAFIFLTRIPVGGGPYTDNEWQSSTGHFPFVGAVLGAMLATLAAAMLPHFGAWPTAFVVLAASMLLTGAFHEDGLADTADALGGAFDREKLFAILKDSRVGTYGAAAVVVSLGLRAALLVELGSSMPLAILLSQGVARLPPLALMQQLPYVTSANPDEGVEAKSRLVARATSRELAVAAAWVLLLAFLVWAADGVSIGRTLAMGLALAGSTALLGMRFQRRAGGITGDFLGATEQVSECIVLLVLVWH